MRPLTASLVISLDGVVAAPHEWGFPDTHDAMVRIVREKAGSADTIVLGRATYEQWAALWADRPSDDGVADFLRKTPKLVASKTLRRVEWANSALLNRDVIEAVRRLKKGTGNEIWIGGGATLVRSLLGAGLVDELRLLLHPIVVGRGTQLFANAHEPRQLDLVASEALPAGVLGMTYRPVGR